MTGFFRGRASAAGPGVTGPHRAGAGAVGPLAAALIAGTVWLAAPPGAAADSMTMEVMKDTRDRPLFAPTRRPPPPPPAPAPTAEPVAEAPVEAAPEPPAPPTAVLTGIVLGGELRLAVFQADGKVQTIRQGGDIEGWTIAEVHPRSITIERDGERTELHLKEPGTGGEGVTPAEGGAGEAAGEGEASGDDAASGKDAGAEGETPEESAGEGEAGMDDAGEAPEEKPAPAPAPQRRAREGESAEPGRFEREANRRGAAAPRAPASDEGRASGPNRPRPPPRN